MIDEDHRCVDMEWGIYHYERWGSLLDEFCALVGGNYAAYGGNSLSTFRVNLSASIFRGSRRFFLGFLTLEDGIHRLSRNVGKKLPSLSNVPDERRYHILRGGSLKSHIVVRRFLRTGFKYLNQFWLFMIHLVASVGGCVAVVLDLK